MKEWLVFSRWTYSDNGSWLGFVIAPTRWEALEQAELRWPYWRLIGYDIRLRI